VTPPLGVTDPVPGNDTATDTNPTGPQANLAISKLSSPNPYVPGAALSYTILVSNAGPSNVIDAQVQDVLPAPLAGFSWTCTPNGAGASCATPAGSGNIDAQVTLQAGTSVTFTVSGTVPAGAGTLINTATVTPPVGITDPVSDNNSATSTLNGTAAQADVAVAKSGPATVVSNGTLSYTLVVTNHGPAAANGAVVTDAAVANFVATTVSCGSQSGGAICPTSPTVAQLQAGLPIPTLPAGGSVTLTVNGTSGVSGAIANAATVTPPAGVTDPVTGNNSSTANTRITSTTSSVAPIPALTAITMALLAALLSLATAISLGRRRRSERNP